MNYNKYLLRTINKKCISRGYFTTSKRFLYNNRSTFSSRCILNQQEQPLQQYIKRHFRPSTPSFEEKRDLYEVLGVSRDASKQDIKKAFYGLAKKYHPDTNSGDPNAHKHFAEISNAYDVLYDDKKRQVYDMAGHQGATAENMEHGGFPGGFPGGFQGGENINVEDLFGGFDLNDLFGGGGGRSKSTQGSDIQVNLHLDFMEAVNGCEKDISFYGGSKCTPCDGSGAKPGTKPQTCKNCGGTGTQTRSNGFFQMASTCRTCKGSGKVIKEHCSTCKGKGVNQGQRTVNIKVPPGINNGSSIRVPGQGEPGLKGGRRGNLFVNVTVSEHELFRRQGNDIHLDVPITLAQAILGDTVTIPTLSGEVDLKVPKGTQPGEKRVLKNKGIPSVNSNGTGSQYIHFIVNIPKNINSKQEELIKEFDQEDKNHNGPLDSLSHPILSFWNKAMKRWREYSNKFKN
ncbi:hypothetical protein DICPUDRAFT_77729 [Dictyostelium purpureum]|uniref:Heat shock protein DnaJ family protein n=1 Tax=Dictyostelium purpureum TaxID=5786 RepID=F0ZHG2_DICPU|nr:uncharacterized protein DICPUDRAFT_77729 [Dictyostelium purpureum]EGC36610.1 hypothetical protein DICPUDRAFT_77729 [Dictyostelium purpureum]|eukprot:XP_003286848.1 hypothetical protein DICPUDRAFT_77729 [Dictyostelium purpureum]